ncbi:MAG: ABC transporter substrate-binding protein [Acidimicrobiia bacterium]
MNKDHKRGSRRFRLLGAAVVASLLVAACGDDSDAEDTAGADPTTTAATSISGPGETAATDTTDPTAGTETTSVGAAPTTDGEPWRIGIVTSFTGPANALGLEEVNSYRLAAKLVNDAGGINGRPIEVIEDDDQSKPEQAIIAVNKQIFQDEVHAIIGGLSTGATLAVKPIVEKEKVVLMSAHVGVATTEDNPQYLFRAGISDRTSNTWLLNQLVDNGLKRLAIIHDSNAYGTGSQDIVQKLIEDEGFDVEVVATQTFKTEDTDMRAQLTSIASSNPDAVYIIGTNPAPALVIKQAHELGLEAAMYGSTGLLSPKTIEIAGADAAEGFIVPGLGIANRPRPEQEEFIEAFRAEYGRDPVGFEFYGDGMYLVLKALEHVTADPSDLEAAREEIKDSLETNINEMSWSFGPSSYSPDNHEGADERSLVPMTITGGAFERLG